MSRTDWTKMVTGKELAAEKTGRWIDNQHWEYANGNMTMSGDTGTKCSVCQVVNFTGIGNQHTAYCPNCGAKMICEVVEDAEE